MDMFFKDICQVETKQLRGSMKALDKSPCDFFHTKRKMGDFFPKHKNNRRGTIEKNTQNTQEKQISRCGGFKGLFVGNFHTPGSLGKKMKFPNLTLR